MSEQELSLGEATETLVRKKRSVVGKDEMLLLHAKRYQSEIRFETVIDKKLKSIKIITEEDYYNFLAYRAQLELKYGYLKDILYIKCKRLLIRAVKNYLAIPTPTNLLQSLKSRTPVVNLPKLNALNKIYNIYRKALQIFNGQPTPCELFTKYLLKYNILKPQHLNVRINN